MEKDEKQQQQHQTSTAPSSNLFALECLATTAGQLHESEKLKQTDDEEGDGSSTVVTTTMVAGTFTTSGVEKEKMSNKVPVVQMAPMSSVTDEISPPLHPISLGSFYPPPFSHAPPVVSSMRPFTEFSFPPPFTHNPFRNFMDMPSATTFGMKMEDMPWRNSSLPPVIPSSRENAAGKGSPALSTNTDKSAFDVVHNHHQNNRNSVSPISNNSFDVGHFQTNGVVMSKPNSIIPQQPPMLFRIDQPPSSNSLLETLVQESQKLLSAQEGNQNEAVALGTNKSSKTSKKKTNQACKTNDDFKKAREMVLISPQKKTSRKRNGSHSVSDVKRAYGGPPFKPGYPPPAVNTAESAMCCFHEHTLLKMATRGFWSGDRGPLQDVFRLSRVESSDLQYDMRAVTKHCYNVVKIKLENADGDRMMMYKHMRNYVDEFDRLVCF